MIAADDGASLTEIARRTELNKTTVYYLVETLASLGFVERRGAAGGYRLGLRNLELGRVVQRKLDIVTIARPALVRLCAATKETVNLAVPFLFEAMIIESVEGVYGVRATAYAGTRSPYHSTACGKAILAHLDESTRRAIYQARPLTPLTPHTIVDIQRLEEELERVRGDGVAYDFEENEESAHCIATPIFDGLGEVAGAISISGPMTRLPTEAVAEVGAVIAAETRLVSAALAGADAETATASRAASGSLRRNDARDRRPATSPAKP